MWIYINYLFWIICGCFHRSCSVPKKNYKTVMIPTSVMFCNYGSSSCDMNLANLYIYIYIYICLVCCPVLTKSIMVQFYVGFSNNSYHFWNIKSNYANLELWSLRLDSDLNHWYICMTYMYMKSRIYLHLWRTDSTSNVQYKKQIQRNILTV